jgi:hypothetical protein
MEKQSKFRRSANYHLDRIKNEMDKLENKNNSLEAQVEYQEHRIDLLMRELGETHSKLRKLYINSTHEIWYRIFINESFFSKEKENTGKFIIQENGDKYRLCIDYFNVVGDDLDALYNEHPWKYYCKGKFYTHGGIILFYGEEFNSYIVQQCAKDLFPSKVIGCYPDISDYPLDKVKFDEAKFEAVNAANLGKITYQTFDPPTPKGADLDIDKDNEYKDGLPF